MIFGPNDWKCGRSFAGSWAHRFPIARKGRKLILPLWAYQLTGNFHELPSAAFSSSRRAGIPHNKLVNSPLIIQNQYCYTTERSHHPLLPFSFPLCPEQQLWNIASLSSTICGVLLPCVFRTGKPLASVRITSRKWTVPRYKSRWKYLGKVTRGETESTLFLATRSRGEAELNISVIHKLSRRLVLFSFLDALPGASPINWNEIDSFPAVLLETRLPLAKGMQKDERELSIPLTYLTVKANLMIWLWKASSHNQVMAIDEEISWLWYVIIEN